MVFKWVQKGGKRGQKGGTRGARTGQKVYKKGQGCIQDFRIGQASSQMPRAANSEQSGGLEAQPLENFVLNYTLNQ